MSDNGEPLQLIEFVKDSDKDDKDATIIQIKHDNLAKVLAAADDHPLCVICICGPSRQGKSFILGHIIRCLTAIEKDENADWMEWDKPDKPLTGFKWQNTYGPVTKGIWIWSRPFIIKRDKKKVAVLLVDTQGTHDEFARSGDMSAIVGLSLLMSSIMIFNFFTNLQEDILSSLSNYIEYGLLAMKYQNDDDEDDDDPDSEYGQEKPFQKLIFLIRDWNNPGEFEYGKKGGEKFIKRKLEIKDEQSKEAQEVRKKIRRCFETMNCFLLPAIGEKALSPQYDGRIGELNPAFSKQMEEFINYSLIDEINEKTLVGNPVTAEELSSYLEGYVSIFNSGNMPTAVSMWEATIMVANANVVEKTTKKYQDVFKKAQRGQPYLSSESLKEAHGKAKLEATKFFKAAKKFGGPDKVKVLMKSCTQEIDKEFEMAKVQNETKRTKILDTAKENAVETYKSFMNEEFSFENEDEFYDDNYIKGKSNAGSQSVMEPFKVQLSHEDEDELEKLVKDLETNFQQILDAILGRNLKIKQKAEEKMNQIVSKILEEYKSKLEEAIQTLSCLKIDEFQKLSLELQEKGSDDFSSAEKPGKKEFQQQFLHNLEIEFEKEYKIAEGEFTLKMKELEKAGEKLVEDLLAKYGEKIDEATTEEKMSDLEKAQENLGQTHKGSSAAILECFKKEAPFPEGHSENEKLLCHLKSEVEQRLKLAERKLRDFQDRVKDSYEDALSDSFQEYAHSVKGIFSDEDTILEDDELEEEHGKVIAGTLVHFKDFQKSGKLPEKDEEGYIRRLKEKMKSDFDRVKELNESHGGKLKAKGEEIRKECLTVYNEIMQLHMEDFKDEVEVQTAHDQAIEKAIRKFQLECPPKIDAASKTGLVKLLKAEAEKACKDVMEFVQLKVEDSVKHSRSVVNSARRFYNSEMKKNMRVAMYMDPEELEALHKKAGKAALETCAEDSELSPEQIEEIEEGLELCYKKFVEDNKMNAENNMREPAIGIDLGTTYCCVGVYLKGKVQIIPNGRGQKTTPSYVAFSEDGSQIIGQPAKDSAYKNPENTIFDAKRIIGRRFGDLNLQDDIKFWPFTVVDDGGIPKIKARSKTYHPEEISAILLKHLKKDAEKYLRCPVTKAVITVPAYFSDGQRQATVHAGKLAGLEVLDILNEPTAGAIAYRMECKDDDARKVVIFDLGGGTFDVAVLDAFGSKIEVLAVDGDTHLGGEDFDKALMQYCAEQFKESDDVDLFAGKDSTNKQERDSARSRLRRIQTYCEKSKKELSTAPIGNVLVDGIKDGTDLNVTVSKRKFEDLTSGKLKETIKITEKALRSAKVTKEEIDDIVLIGGSTRIPRLQEMLEDYFGKPMNITINPDEAVALGAAIHAAIKNGIDSFDIPAIQDVTPMSYGIEIADGGFSVIIPKNSKIPANIEKEYCTEKDKQTSVAITIYQGEEMRAKDNIYLGKFTVTGIPPKKAGKVPVFVEMEIDSMGILRVTGRATDVKEEVCLTVESDNKGLTDELVNDMLKKDNDEDDFYYSDN